jgi:very-short-patch-repair endonuclease
LVDLATCTGFDRLDRAVNEADRLGLIDPESLASALDAIPPRPGVGRLRSLLDSHTFAPTDSVLERRFLSLVRAAGLPPPKTQVEVSGFRVDFYWPALGLVVETDGLHYHRTPSQQKKDRLRDQAHAVSGVTALRFAAAQVHYEPKRVKETLVAVAGRLATRP